MHPIQQRKSVNIKSYNILAELQAQNKKIILCKVPAHIRSKGDKEADKTAKQAIRLLYTN